MRTTSVLTITAILLLGATACRDAAPDSSLAVFNSPPAVSITSPTNESSVIEGAAIEFEGIVSDDAGVDSLMISWTSDLDGPLEEGVLPNPAGYVSLATASLSPGNHIITLLAVDGDAEKGEDFITVSVIDVPDAPTIFIAHPAGGESGIEDEDFTFVAKVGDGQDPANAIEVSVNAVPGGLVCVAIADIAGVASCDGELDPGDHTVTFTATDLDGFTTDVDTYFVVIPLNEIDNDGDGFTEVVGDCDDDDKYVYPGATEIVNGRDDDCDGVIDEGTLAYDDDGDGLSEQQGDCNDADSGIYPNAVEIIDGKDNDCNGLIDDNTDAYDDDGDGWTENQGDCDDETSWGPLRYPGATEIENNLDDDCDGRVDNNTDAYDDDGDGFTERQGDCNDADPTINPGASEIGDFKDNDCNGLIDDRTSIFDNDGDGFSAREGDCNDTDPSMYPPTSPGAGDGGDEIIDGKDNDCNGLIDDGTDVFDDDHDGYSELQGDCDDDNNTVYPNAPEIEDGIDNNCNGLVDEGGQGYDDDGDGYSENDGDCNDFDPTVFPTATEVCDDGKDSDCNGQQNEEDATNCQPYFKDFDNDGAGDANVASRCFCFNGDKGDFTVLNNTDCYDNNGLAKPGGAFQKVHRGDGSFDYNCDGSTTKRFVVRSQCSWIPFECVSNAGWMDSVQACGATGKWTVDCSIGWNVCDRDHDSNVTQECK